MLTVLREAKAVERWRSGAPVFAVLCGSVALTGYWYGSTAAALMILTAAATCRLYRHREEHFTHELAESERRRAGDLAERQRVLDSHARLAAIVEVTTDLVAIADRSGRLLYANPAALRFMAIPAGTDITQLSITDMLSGPDHVVLVDGLPTAIRDGIWSSETELRSLDGRTIDVSQILIGHKDGDGRVSLISTIARDISERKATEAVLRQSIARFDLAARASFNVIWEFDVERGLVWRNENFQTLFGYEPGEHAAELTAWVSAVHPDDCDRVRARFTAAVQSDVSAWEDSFRYRRKDGSYAAVEDRCEILRDSAGRAVRMVGAMHDVSEREHAQQLLQLQSAALSAAANGIAITDRSGTIVWTNPGFSAMTGYDRAEAAGSTPGQLLKSGVHGREFYRDLWNTVLAGHIWQGEMTNRRKDGSLYPERQTITPVTRADGLITHLIAIKEDLTVQKRLEDQFIQAQKMDVVGQLAGGIAHDFNNLLTVINMSADFLAGDLPADSSQRADALQIMEAGKRAASLTRQLLAFSRKQVLRPTQLHLGQLALSMQNMLQRLIGVEIELVVSSAEDLGLVEADAGQLEQVIMNLAVNARDAMPDGGRLTIEAADIDLVKLNDGCGDLSPGPYVVLKVSDTGTGMDDNTRAHLFEPFFSTKQPGHGTGLGLSTVYGIIKQSGGGISVESAPGCGSRFNILLPCVSPATASMASSTGDLGERPRCHSTC